MTTDGFVWEPNDIALLELDGRVEFKEHIAPICLPQKGVNFSKETAVLAGWGLLQGADRALPFLLQKIEVPVLPNDECYASFSAANYSKYQRIPETQLCTAFKDNESACSGDSGGPLVVTKKGRARLIGITSWHYGCGNPNTPSVYTNVTNFVDWIKGNMRPACKKG